MFKGSSDYISLTLGDDVLKVAHVKVAGGAPRVQKVAHQNIQDVPETDLPKVIQRVLGKAKGSRVVYVISPSMVSTKNIEIPSTQTEEIKSIVNLQAARHTPFSRNEIQIGYLNIGVYKSNYTKVLLIIANRSLLKQKLDILERAGINVEKVIFAPECIAQFYAHVLRWKADTTPQGIIDVGKSSTDFVIALHGTAIAARNIPIGKTDLVAEGEPALTKLVEELGKTVEAYLSEDIDQTPAHYVITGADEHAQTLQTLVKEKLQWDVDAAPYLDQVKASPGVLRDIGDQPDVSFLDLISAAAMAPAANVNLMPEEVEMQKSIEDQGREFRKTAVFAIVFFVLILAAIGMRLHFQKSYLAKLQNEYKSTRERVSQLEKIAMRTELIKYYLTNRMVSLDTIYELYRNVPDEIYLTNLVIDDEGGVSLQGVSTIASLVFNLGTTLKESNMFKSVNIKSTTAKKDRGADATAFEITLKLKTAIDDDDGQTAKME